MKRILIIAWLMIFFHNCQHKQSENDITSIDFNEVKRIVWDNYSKNESNFFTEYANNLFKEYLKNIDQLVDSSYDVIYDGLLIKYFYCPGNDFSFSVIRGVKGHIYYVGLSDLVYFKNLKDSLYFRDNDILQKKKLGLEILKYELPVTSYFNEIFNNEPSFLLFEGQNEHERVMALKKAYSLVYLVHQIKIEGYFSLYESVFEFGIPPEDLMASLKELTNESDSSTMVQVSKQLDPYPDKSLESRVFLYKVDNNGIVGFKYIIDNNYISVSEFFIPQDTRLLDFACDLNY